MSGTEAVMCAIRLCRFNTRRKLIVQFWVELITALTRRRFPSISQLEGRVDVDVACASVDAPRESRVATVSQHAGWWDGVQPGPLGVRARTVTFYI